MRWLRAILSPERSALTKSPAQRIRCCPSTASCSLATLTRPFCRIYVRYMATLETMRRIKEPPYAEISLPRDDSKGELAMTDQNIKIPLTDMDGVPTADDPAVAELTEVFAKLPRENLEWAISLLMRAAVGWERTGRTELLETLAESALVTTRLRRDPETDRALREAPKKPAAPEESVNVEEALRERGML